MMTTGNTYRNGAVILMLVAVSWYGVLDRYAEQYINESISVSMASFALARLFNGTISVLSTITLQVPFIGSVQIGELLDPLNDLVEDFSTVMKYSISSLLIQKFMVEILQTIHFKLFLTLAGVVYMATHFVLRAFHSTAYKVFILAVACKFAIVLVAIASSWVDHAFIDQNIKAQNDKLSSFPVSPSELNSQLDLSAEIKRQIEQELSQLDEQYSMFSLELDAFNGQRRPEEAALASVDAHIKRLSQERSILDNLINKSPELKQAEQERVAITKRIALIDEAIAAVTDRLNGIDQQIINLSEKLDHDDVSTFESLRYGLSNMAATAKDKITGYVTSLNLSVEHFVNLMALFVFKTMVIPLVFLLGMYKVFQAIWKITPAAAARSLHAQALKMRDEAKG